jgi:hypothetical protein
MRSADTIDKGVLVPIPAKRELALEMHNTNPTLLRLTVAQGGYETGGYQGSTAYLSILNRGYGK